MLPVLFRLGPLTIHSYGFMLALGFLAGVWLLSRELALRGRDPGLANDLILAAMIGGVVGAKINFLIGNWEDVRGDFWGAAFSGAGLTWYGGLIGGTLLVLLTARRKGLPLVLAADATAPGLALGYVFGRIGCLLNGDDYGRPTDLPWAMTFPKGSPPTDIPVHPTQIYEIVLTLGIVAVLLSLRGRAKREGLAISVYLLLAGLERLVVEIWRTNVPVLPGLTVAQITSLLLIAAGLLLSLRTLRAARRTSP